VLIAYLVFSSARWKIMKPNKTYLLDSPMTTFVEHLPFASCSFISAPLSLSLSLSLFLSLFLFSFKFLYSFYSVAAERSAR